jgi:hypothetical protein
VYLTTPTCVTTGRRGMSTEDLTRVMDPHMRHLTRVMDDRKDSPHPLPQAPNGLAPPSISSRRAIPLSHHYVTS